MAEDNKALRKEIAELRRSNEILKAAARCTVERIMREKGWEERGKDPTTRPPSPMMVIVDARM